MAAYQFRRLLDGIKSHLCSVYILLLIGCQPKVRLLKQVNEALLEAIHSSLKHDGALLQSCIAIIGCFALLLSVGLETLNLGVHVVKLDLHLLGHSLPFVTLRLLKLVKGGYCLIYSTLSLLKAIIQTADGLL